MSDIEDRDERALRLAACAAATDAYADVDVPLVHGRVFEPTNADPKCIKEQRPDGLTHAEKIAFGKARAEWERLFGHRIRSGR